MSTALLLIDAQRNMLEGDAAVPSALAVRVVLDRLLSDARSAGACVAHVQNDGHSGDPDEPGSLGWELVFDPAEGELVARKDQPDTFTANPILAAELRDRGVTRVVVAGMQSEFCVQATAHGALAEGFEVVLPRGAHATYDNELAAAEEVARVERTLQDEGVLVLDAAAVEF